MNQTTRLANLEDAPVMRPMLRAYQEYIGQFSGSVDPDRVLEDAWFEKPGMLFPFLISRNDRPVGILLIMGRAYAEASGVEVDYCINDLYVTPEVRGTGIAAKAVAEVIDLFQGTWCLDVLDENQAALGFWRKTLPDFVNDLVVEGPHDKFLRFHFSS